MWTWRLRRDRWKAKIFGLTGIHRIPGLGFRVTLWRGEGMGGGDGVPTSYGLDHQPRTIHSREILRQHSNELNTPTVHAANTCRRVHWN